MTAYRVDVKAFKVFEIEASNRGAAREKADMLAEAEGWEVDGESEVELADD